jgi:hypothetical protein
MTAHSEIRPRGAAPSLLGEFAASFGWEGKNKSLIQQRSGVEHLNEINLGVSIDGPSLPVHQFHGIPPTGITMEFPIPS